MRFVLTVCLMLFASPVFAQSISSTNSQDTPVTIDAREGIEWNRDEQVYVARGDVVAKQGDVTVNSQVLTAKYRDKKIGEETKTEIYELIATEDVLITNPQQKVTGDNAVYDVDKGRFVITGQNLKLTTPTEEITARDSLEYYENDRTAYAKGNATVYREDNRLNADQLKALFVEDAQGEMAIQDIFAIHNVSITTATEVARGNKGHYNAKTGIATLVGDVKLTRADNQLSGDVAEVNLKTGISKLLSYNNDNTKRRVQGLFKTN